MQMKKSDMNKTKQICYLAVLSALYVVMSAFLRIPLISHLWLDLGYIVFSVAICMFGLPGTIVGVAGCAIESILFSQYGLSVSWVAANTIIGVWCGLCFQKTDKTWKRISAIILSNFVGFAVMKPLSTVQCTQFR